MRRAIIAVVVLAVAVGAVFEGRREGRHAVRVNVANMLRIQVAEGATGTGVPFALTYDASARITCLIFRADHTPIGLQTCYTDSGQLVEAVDQTTPGAHFWSLRYDQHAAPVAINPIALRHMRTEYSVVSGYTP